MRVQERQHRLNLSLMHRHMYIQCKSSHRVALLTHPYWLPAGATTYRTVLNVDRGLSWEDAVAMRDANVEELQAAGGPVDPLVGFHLATYSKEIGKTGDTCTPAHPQPDR